MYELCGLCYWFFPEILVFHWWQEDGLCKLPIQKAKWFTFGFKTHRLKRNFRVWGLLRWTTLSNAWAWGDVMKWIHEQWWQDYRRSLRVLIWVNGLCLPKFLELLSHPLHKQSRQAGLSHKSRPLVQIIWLFWYKQVQINQNTACMHLCICFMTNDLKK